MSISHGRPAGAVRLPPWRDATAGPATNAAKVTVVHAPDCHLCDDARAALAELGRTYPLTVELVAAAEERGAALLRRHRAGLFPLVLLDGEFFSAGRLPRRKLAKLLTGRVTAAPTGTEVGS